MFVGLDGLPRGARKWFRQTLIMPDNSEQNPVQPGSLSPWRLLFFWVLFIMALVFLFWNRAAEVEFSYSEFRNELRAGNVEEILMRGERLEGAFREPVDREIDGEIITVERFETYLPVVGDEELLAMTEEHDVRLHAAPDRDWGMLMLLALPFVLILVIGLIIFNQLRQRGQGMLSFTQSRAKLYDRSRAGVTFNDVAGTEGAKEELKQTVDFLKDPDYFKRLGGSTPRGVLLVGPPGTGKTLLAKAVAGEAEAPFFSVSGSDFMEMFVGIGASRVRKMFEDAKKQAPSIIFIDELDSIGRRRGTGIGGGHDEREQTLNQLLSEMDGFEGHENVIVMAATNRPDILDKALLRPGRFDRQITVDLPNRDSRLQILKIHARGKKLASDVHFDHLAKSTPGFSGADLQNLLNEAALVATVGKKGAIDSDDIDSARDRILLGRRREGVNLSQEDLKLLAYHESGHALAAILLPNTDPIEKISIVPRGRSMGVTQQLPEEEKYIYKQDYVLDHLTVMMGGRAAEELVFQTATSGATEDFHQATRLARKMVVEFGMSKILSRMHLGNGDHQVFLGEEMAKQRDYSEATAEKIDKEVCRILENAYNRAVKVLDSNRNKLDRLAHELLEREEITGDEALRAVGISRQESIQRPPGDQKPGRGD